MFASLSSAWMLRLKKYGYWIWLIDEPRPFPLPFP